MVYSHEEKDQNVSKILRIILWKKGSEFGCLRPQVKEDSAATLVSVSNFKIFYLLGWNFILIYSSVVITVDRGP
ncbi:hypothetical protein NQ318_006417 [Aromia moschata]|uniref:Uncharacterized protein n=1 Tax=Aromia moschata TaxID=1265417 RepID=A0AAV8X7M5_9CUCU|nr:hypothetical protein NQ318_006417 [Aromia moschata]